MDAFQGDRRRALRTWQPGVGGELVGAGKYGRVYRCGRGAVVKEVDASSEPRRAQAYREHVVGLLQTLLVLSSATPHLPLHFGASWRVARDAAQLSLHMEAFETTLEAAGRHLLVDAEAWLSLFFQVWSAVVALAYVFGVAHNDLYPRNVLLRPAARHAVSYEVLGTRYRVPWPFFAALTDFGLASSPLLGSAALRLRCAVPAPPRLGLLAPRQHILELTGLPALCRDPYALLKWAAFPSRSLPAAPEAVGAWARDGLERLDLRRQECCSGAGAAQLFAAAFRSTSLRRRGLPRLDDDGGPPAMFCLRHSAPDELLPRAALALGFPPDEAEDPSA